MGCMSLLLELKAAEGIIAPAGFLALTIFLGKRKKTAEILWFQKKDVSLQKI